MTNGQRRCCLHRHQTNERKKQMCHFMFILLHDGIISYIYNKRACRLSRLRLKLFPTFNLVLVLGWLLPLPCVACCTFTSELHLFSGNYYFTVWCQCLCDCKLCARHNGKWHLFDVSILILWQKFIQSKQEKSNNSPSYVSYHSIFWAAVKIIKRKKEVSKRCRFIEISLHLFLFIYVFSFATRIDVLFLSSRLYK